MPKSRRRPDEQPEGDESPKREQSGGGSEGKPPPSGQDGATTGEEQQHVPAGTYRALPIIDEDVVEHLFTDGGMVDQLAESLEDLNAAIHRVDEEMEGLRQANPGLGRLVQSSVDGLYGVLKDELPNEASRAYLRVCTYFGTFLILRSLDLQWRRLQPP